MGDMVGRERAGKCSTCTLNFRVRYGKLCLVVGGGSRGLWGREEGGGGGGVLLTPTNENPQIGTAT